MAQCLVSVIGDTLTYYDAALSIFSNATKPGSECMKNAVSLYATGLIDVWTKTFGAAHVITRRSVKIKLDKLCEYYNDVYSVLHRKNTKHDVSGKSKSGRQLNKEWKKKIAMKPDVLNGDIL